MNKSNLLLEWPVFGIILLKIGDKNINLEL